MLTTARRVQRERWVIVTAMGAVTVLAWAYLLDRAGGRTEMGGMGMSGMTEIRPWTATDYGLTLVMWVVMMIGMMLPSAVPMTLIFAAIARKARRQGSPLPPTFVFVIGYLVVWAAFSVAATTAQLGLERAALLSSTMASSSHVLGGSLLLAAGTYQLTPLKGACLRRCRAPANFLADHWRSSTVGVLTIGVHTGIYCLGCCWVLMALLFVGGVMNLLWVAVIALFVLVEKALPLGEQASLLAGGPLIAAGAAVLAFA